MSRREPDRFAPLAERLAWGKSRRKALPRVAQAEWRARPSRPDPVDVLLAASRGRVPELLPIKWGRMAASPFGYFRGAVPVMARDLASQRVSGLTVQMCGDAHVRNLGARADRRRGCARGLRREVRPPPRAPRLRRGAGSGRYWAPKESP